MAINAHSDGYMLLSVQIRPWLLAFVIAVTSAVRHGYWQLDKYHSKTRHHLVKTRQRAKAADQRLSMT